MSIVAGKRMEENLKESWEKEAKAHQKVKNDDLGGGSLNCTKWVV